MDRTYIKSEKGLKEFEDGATRTLSLKHRQLLIMIDGTRTNTELAKLFSNMDATQMLQDLEKLGYLIDKNSSVQTQTGDQNRQQDIIETLTHEHIEFIKSFLVSELELQVGLIMSKDLVTKIKAIRHHTELKPAIARWHMAIRDSKNGRTVSDMLMGKLHHIIANPPSVASSKRAS